MDAVACFEPIPGPPSHLLVGNLFDVDADHLIESLADLARRYGLIYRIEVPGRGLRVIVSGHALVDELCDDARFDKQVGPGLAALAANPASRGLFTAETSDPNWRKAHNVLLPAFSLGAMRGYFSQMLDVARQLVQKWERSNPDDAIDVPADMTRLTLDTIALCGFGYRFNSFYRDTPHPFVVAMLGSLEASQARMRELPIQARLHPGRARKLRADQQFMTQTVQHLIERRRASGAVGTVGDLLDRMLTGVDPQSGERLDDANIVAQCITFLIAGHETTSGLLSFALYALLKSPDALARSYDEVDAVLGRDLTAPPTQGQVHGLRYVAQVLDEALRLWPTAPAFTRSPYEDTVIGGKYRLQKGCAAVILTGMLHRDQQVWGEAPEAFDPDRFAPENRANIPPNAYKPFGTGQRACIGRQFALQEAALVLGMILQRFELVDFTGYQLETKQTLTIKPSNFHIRVKLRAKPAPIAPPMAERPVKAPQPTSAPASNGDTHRTPLLVLYGSNLGTAESLARAVAEDGRDRGFRVTTGALDDHAGSLPTEGGVIVVTASYNGQPPDNAAGFCRWLLDPSLAADAFTGVSYAVFGCGNRDWAATYQAVPALIAAQFEKHGAAPLCVRGEGDARGDLDADYRTWQARLWPSVATTLRLPDDAAQAKARAPRCPATPIAGRTAVAAFRDALCLTVCANHELQRRDDECPAERSTRHLELGLPAGVAYGTGDHLAIIPHNDPKQIRRVLLRFEPGADMDLAGRVELQSVATRAQLAALAGHARDDVERRTLLALGADDESSRARYRQQVSGPRRSVLDVLDAFPSCMPPFEVLLGLLPPLRPRYYSISSSPLAAPEICSITVGVVAGPTRDGCGTVKGICSNYLAAQPVGAAVRGFVRKPGIPFHPPDDPRAPLIMIGCGTGVAPFRGFLQERAALKQRGVPLGKAMLLFGCRDPLQDFLYKDELRAFEAAGIMRLLPAFSREPGKPRTYVQQVIETECEAVWRLLRQDAAVYVCGEASGMAPAVRQAFANVFREHTGATAVDAQAWLAGLVKRHRYLEDVWASAA